MKSKISGNSSKVQSGPFPCCVYVKDAQGEYCFQPKCFHTFAENSNMGRGTGFRIFVNDYLYHSFNVYISIERIISKTSYCIADFDSSSPNSKNFREIIAMRN